MTLTLRGKKVRTQKQGPRLKILELETLLMTFLSDSDKDS